MYVIINIHKCYKEIKYPLLFRILPRFTSCACDKKSEKRLKKNTNKYIKMKLSYSFVKRMKFRGFILNEDMCIVHIVLCSRRVDYMENRWDWPSVTVQLSIYLSLLSLMLPSNILIYHSPLYHAVTGWMARQASTTYTPLLYCLLGSTLRS